MSKCIALLGASGVGKTAVASHLCALEGGSAAAPEAHQMAISPFTFLGDSWTVIDCPGSIEFLQQSMDALLAADIAVICVAPEPDQAVLAAPYLRLAEQAGVPSMLFVNRVDEATARARDIVAALQAYARHPIVLRQIPMRRDGEIVGAVDLVSERAWAYRKGQASELIEIPADLADREAEARAEVLESLSDYDDWLLEELIEDRSPACDAIWGICARVLRENTVLPAFIGSAALGNGITRLMKALRHETPDVSALADRLGGAAAVALRAHYAKHVGKQVTLRALAPLQSGAVLGGAPLGAVTVIGGGAKAAPGALLTAIKSDHLAARTLYGPDALPAPAWYRPLPAQVSQAIVPENERDDAKLSDALAKLAAEDASLTLSQDRETGAPVLHGQGTLHLRDARQHLAETFGVAVAERPVTPDLCETISKPVDVHYRHKKQSGGAGQFADVKMTVAPLPRGEGFRFEQRIHGGSVPKNYIPAVEAGATEATGSGPLGFRVVDIEVTLTDGQHHNVDSSDMAFRIAGRGAVRDALGQAGPVLLEPIYAVSLAVPSIFTGAINPLIGARRGQVLGFDRLADAEGWDEVRALLPGGALDTLAADLRSATQGVGRFEARFDHYQELYGKEAEHAIASRAKVLEDA